MLQLVVNLWPYTYGYRLCDIWDGPQRGLNRGNIGFLIL